MSNSAKRFEIWVELDEYDTTENRRFGEEFCNAIIHFSDGSRIGLNIWSENYFYDNVNHLDWINNQFAILPDIVVRDFNALSIRQAVITLVDKHDWLEGRGFPVVTNG